MTAPNLENVVRAHVVAPHPDDEAIGAFGLIGALRRRGAIVDVSLVTDGGASHPNTRWPRARLTAARYRETRCVLRRAGLRQQDLRCLDYRDGELGFAGAATERRLARDLRRCPRPDLIVAPSLHDNHADHRAIARAVRRAWPDSIARLSYLVWPRIQPHRPRPAGRAIALKLGARAQAKRAALRLYRTQIDGLDDPGGFRITPALLARFGHPVERFGNRP